MDSPGRRAPGKGGGPHETAPGRIAGAARDRRGSPCGGSSGGKDVRHPLGGLRAARDGLRRSPPGGPGRSRRPREGRERGGRGDRGQRRARFPRADLVRPRGRPVRDGLGREDGQAVRPERVGPRAALADRGPGPSRAGRHDPALLSLLLDRARRRGRVVRAARAVRQAADEGDPGAGHRRRTGGGAGPPGDRRLLGARREGVPGQAWVRGDVPARREAAGRGGDLPEPGTRTDLRDDRREGTGRVLQGTDRRGDRRVLEAGGRVLLPSGPRRAPVGVGRADLHHVPRCHGLGAPPPTGRGSPRSRC